MKWDQKRAEAILRRPDGELKQKARAVMEALGLSEEQQEKLLGDWAGLKEKASEVDESDFYKVRLLLGDERLEELVGILEGKNE